MNIYFEDKNGFFSVRSVAGGGHINLHVDFRLEFRENRFVSDFALWEAFDFAHTVCTHSVVCCLICQVFYRLFVSTHV